MRDEFDVSGKQTSKIDILFREITSSGEEKITPRIFLKFSELKYERKWVHFSPYEFFFIISIYT